MTQRRAECLQCRHRNRRQRPTVVGTILTPHYTAAGKKPITGSFFSASFFLFLFSSFFFFSLSVVMINWNFCISFFCLFVCLFCFPGLCLFLPVLPYLLFVFCLWSLFFSFFFFYGSTAVFFLSAFAGTFKGSEAFKDRQNRSLKGSAD